MTASTHQTKPTIEVRLDLPDWDNILAALGAAAELTTAYLRLTCDDCGSRAGTCPTHNPDWDGVDRWRALATALRGQLTATPPARTDHAR